MSQISGAFFFFFEVQERGLCSGGVDGPGEKERREIFKREGGELGRHR